MKIRLVYASNYEAVPAPDYREYYKDEEFECLPPRGSRIFLPTEEDEVGIALKVVSTPAFFPRRPETTLLVRALSKEGHKQLIPILLETGWRSFGST